MLDFRKVLLATVAGFGLVATASAQVPSCTLSVNNEGYVAVEGTTEEIPQLQLNCTGAGTFTGPLNLTLTGSVPFANQAQSALISNLDISVVDSAGDTLTSANGTITQPGPATIQITLNTVTAAATNTFWVTGVRVNPSTLSAGATVTVSASSTSVQITNLAAVNAAFAAKTISSVVIDAGGLVANQSVCGIVTSTNPTLFPVGNATVTAGFLNSLKLTTDYTNDPLSTAYYGNPAPNTTNAPLAEDAVAVAAKMGTRFAVTIGGLDPAGVAYYVPASIAGTNVTVSAYAAATGSTLATTVASGNAAGLVALTVSSSGTATVYYGVSGGTTAGGSQVFVLPVQAAIASGGGSAVTSFSTTPITVSLQLVGATAPAYPGENAAASAYASTLQSGNATNGLITSCSTTLLFPYVVNSSGFDTGVVITNASTGVGVAAGSGTCSVAFYGAGAPTTAYVTPAIPTATNTTFTASGQAPTLNGYAVATCNFVGAHGYAFIFSGAGTPAAYAADYLAVIIGSGNLGAATTLTVLN